MFCCLSVPCLWWQAWFPSKFLQASSWMFPKERDWRRKSVGVGDRVPVNRKSGGCSRAEDLKSRLSTKSSPVLAHTCLLLVCTQTRSRHWPSSPWGPGGAVSSGSEYQEDRGGRLQAATIATHLSPTRFPLPLPLPPAPFQHPPSSSSHSSLPPSLLFFGSSPHSAP